MSDWWRNKARELLPEFTDLAADLEETAYLFLSELVVKTHDALRNGDERTATRYFEYAHRCLSQRQDEHAHNAARVCFYEYIFDDNDLVCLVAPHLDNAILESIEPLLRFAYGDEKFDLIKCAINEHAR